MPLTCRQCLGSSPSEDRANGLGEPKLISIDQRKFRSQTSDNMDRWKSRDGKSQRGEEKKKEDAGGRKVAIHCVVSNGLWPRESKSRLAKAAGVEPAGQMRDEKLHAVLARSTMCKTHQVRTTFGSCDVEKVHAIVARSAFRSQNAQNTPGPDHFWKLRCRKSARRCGAKHIGKSKCTKHPNLGPRLEVEMSKKCRPL